MAITGTFAADFSAFTSAVEQAEVKLKGFEGNSVKVENALSKMTNALSGTKLIQDATLAVEAVERIGGVSKLTEAELQKVAHQAADAVEKLKALGSDVPAGMQKLANEAKTVNTHMTSMTDLAKQAAGAFVAMFSVQAFTSAVGGLIAFAGQMTDLSAKTGIGTTALQEFKAAGAQVGVSLDSITGATAKLENAIGSGDKSALGALKLLGIGFDDIRDAKPEDQFSMVAEKLGKVTDQTAFVKLGMDLMGKGFMEVAPLIREDLEQLREAARKLGVVLDEQTVANLDNLGDSMTALQGVGQAVLADVLTPFIPALTAAAGWMMQFGHAIDDAQVAFEQLLSIGAGWAKYLDDQAIKVLSATNAYGMFDSRIAALKEDSARYGAIANDLATTHVTLAAAVTATHPAFDRLKVDLETAAAAAAKEKAEAEQVAAIVASTAKGYHDLYFDMKVFGIKQIAEMTAGIEKEFARQRTVVSAAQADLLGMINASNAAHNVEALGGAQSLDAQLEALATTHQATLARIEAAGRLASSQGGTAWLEQSKRLTQEADAAFQTAWNGIVAGANKAGPAASGALDQIDASAKKATATVDGLGYSMDKLAHIQQLLKDAQFDDQQETGSGVAAREAMIKRETAFKMQNPGSFPSFAGGVQNFAGGLALVGERGPELVNLPGGSDVIPMGGTTINATIAIYVTGETGAQAGRAAADALRARMMQRGIKI